MGFLLAAQLVMFAVPYAAGRALNGLQIKGSDGLKEAALWLASIIGLTLVSWAVHGPGRLLERKVSLRLRQRMSSDLIERLVQLPLSWHESQRSGATAHRVQQSVNALAGFAERQYVHLSSLVRLFGPIIALARGVLAAKGSALVLLDEPTARHSGDADAASCRRATIAPRVHTSCPTDPMKGGTP